VRKNDQGKGKELVPAEESVEGTEGEAYASLTRVKEGVKQRVTRANRYVRLAEREGRVKVITEAAGSRGGKKVKKMRCREGGQVERRRLPEQGGDI